MAEEDDARGVAPTSGDSDGEGADEWVAPEVARETDEEPPEPNFLIVRNAFGPGTHSVKFPDGTPVGVFISERGLDGEEVRRLLTQLDLESDLVEFFASNRDKAIAATKALEEDSGYQSLAASEALHDSTVATFRDEFLRKQGKKR